LIKRWLKKREFMVYMLLYFYSKSIGKKEFNEEELVDIVKLILGSKRVSRNVIRHLVKQGLLERKKPLRYRVRDFEEIFSAVLSDYVCKRLERQGFEVLYTSNGRCVVVTWDCEKLKPLILSGAISCSHSSS
jgi:hypothetical protein